jgi:hypothetical protein
MKPQTGLDRLLLNWFKTYGFIKAASITVTLLGMTVKGTMMYSDYKQDQKDKAERIAMFEQKADKAAIISERVEKKIDAIQNQNAIEFKKMAIRDSIQMARIEILSEKKTLTEPETIIIPGGYVKQIDSKKNLTL